MNGARVAANKRAGALDSQSKSTKAASGATSVNRNRRVLKADRVKRFAGLRLQICTEYRGHLCIVYKRGGVGANFYHSWQ